MRCGLVSCHNIVKSFHAFIVTSHLLNAYIHLCLFLNFPFFLIGLGQQNTIFIIVLSTLKKFSWFILLNLFLHMNLPWVYQVLYQTPTGCKGDLDEHYAYKLMCKPLIYVNLHLCLWFASSYMQAIGSFFIAVLDMVYFHIFSSAFVFVAIENDFVNSIKIFCYDPRC